ncbi:LacI family DNA-binding transcriptional regulator [Acidisoma cellulosilytica]|uniref:LacI family DNA-binding transcriptional regulator n=1 Tax=Acidisoma cellulosilyticum TaxID=2802395 RepID=A0A964E468_9PROT|nr:LacI family DNA-binding transcriptional regulator [Acidisoma cellulosilyticum]MCB8881159.1 LacI family DNA-binding transcriptional regulator [Acidisoma cellulosilyticum]
MSRTFLVKEIAGQSGLSVATVDRVLNDRPGVRALTRLRVEEAIRDLENQSRQRALSGRKFTIDLVMETPARFSAKVRAALEVELPTLQPAVFRARFHLWEMIPTEALVQALDSIRRRGSHGVILKAADVPEVAAAIDRLTDAGIPVVTMVTDLPHSRRHAYVGIDNRAAGETAAYLIGAWLKPSAGQVLVTLSSNRFRGEEEREAGFRHALRRFHPDIGIVEISEGFGRDQETVALARHALLADSRIAGAYSIGGGNRAVLEAFAEAQRSCVAFVAHDLDVENATLLRERQISAVLHHDLNQDMRKACRHIMQAHGALKEVPGGTLSPVQVITPFNLPPGA